MQNNIVEKYTNYKHKLTEHKLAIQALEEQLEDTKKEVEQLIIEQKLYAPMETLCVYNGYTFERIRLVLSDGRIITLQGYYGEVKYNHVWYSNPDKNITCIYVETTPCYHFLNYAGESFDAVVIGYFDLELDEFPREYNQYKLEDLIERIQ